MTHWPMDGGEMAGRIRAFDWAATPLGPIAGWPQSLRVATRLLLNTRHPMFIWWGPELIQLYNDAYRDTMGPEKHPAALGGPGRETWAEIWDAIGPQIAQVMRGGPATWHEDQFVPVTRHGDRQAVWWTYGFSPIDDEAAPNGVGGVLVICRDVTQEHLARAAALESEARYRAFVTASADVVYRMSPDWSVMQRLDGVGFLADTPEPRTTWLETYIHPDDRPAVQAAIRDAIATRTQFELEHRVRRADGTLGWTLSRAVPILDAGGEIVEWLGAASDVTARKEAATALRDSEERYQALFAASPVPFMVLAPNPPDFTITAANDAYLAATLTTREGLVGRRLFDVFTDDPSRPGQLGSDALSLSLGRVLSSRRTDAMQRIRYDIATPDGGFEPHWWLAINAPMLDATGRIRAIIHQVTRVTELHLAELAERDYQARQAFLLELSDVLGPLKDPVAIQDAAMRMLGANLKVNRAFYGDAEDGRDTLAIGPGYSLGTSSLQGQVKVSDFEPDMAAWYRAGRTYVIEDAQRDARFGEKAKAGFAAIEVGAALGVPLVRQGRVRAIVTLHQCGPRRWTAGEIALLEDTAERTWAAVERARAEARLRESEELRRIALDGGGMGAWRWDTRDRSVWADEAVQGLWGISAPAQPHRVSAYADMMHPEGAGWLEAVTTKDIAPGEEFQDQVQVASGPTSGRWVQLRGRAQRDKPWIINGVSFDITAQKLAEAAFRDSEERFAQFVASSSDALWIRDAATLEMEYVSPAIEAIYGVPPANLLDGPSSWAALILPEDRGTALAHLDQAKAGGAVVHEFRIRRPSDGSLRWIRNTDFPLRNIQGRVQRIGGIAQDVTEAKVAIERQDVLVAELQHRTRNLIAVVRGIADETMRETGPTEAFRVAFADRLSALSRVQGLLSRSEAEPITIGSLLRLELDALGAGAAGDRVTVAGPEVFLRPSTVQTLALALHELATNARKHGALSHAGGHLAVTWQKRSEAGERRLVIEWIETGLEQALERPGSEKVGGGYGRELIEHALPHTLGARTRYELTASGVCCTIDLAVRPGKGMP